MRPRDFIKNIINNKELPPVSVLLGIEEYWKKIHIKRIKSILYPEQDADLNCFVFNASETKIETVLDEINSFGFFGTKKLVIFENPEVLDNDSQKKLLQYAENPNTENTLILIADKLDNRKALGKDKKLKTLTVNYSVKDKNDIKEFIHFKIKEYGLTIENNLLDLLIRSFPGNFRLLANNIDKIAAHAGYTSPLRIENSLVINTDQGEVNSFNIIHYLMQRDLRTVIRMYRKACLKQDKGFQFMFIGALRSHFASCLRVKQMIINKDSSSQSQLNSKLSSFIINKITPQIRNFSFAELREYYAGISEIDYKLKSSTASPDVLMELFFQNICRPVNQLVSD